ncbi:MAG: calcium-binding protein [Deltaproteobacteria bacterium]|nr:calcium-binding protein [Deltaproteobacteria bacterium]
MNLIGGKGKERRSLLMASVVLATLAVVGSAPVRAVTCNCAGATYTCSTGTCNPHLILGTALQCDWNCNSAGCPDLSACPSEPCDRNGDGKCVLCGYASNAEWIVGTPGDDAICAKGGDDVIDVHQGGNDLVDAGLGNDTVQAGTGDDYIFGDDGNDCIGGGGGSDVIDGEVGNDGIFSTCIPSLPLTCPASFPDLVIGSRLCGGKGNDLVVGYGHRGHECIDGGPNQASIELGRCGFGSGGPDCWYVANFGDDHDVATFRNCSIPLVFGTGTALSNSPMCGCF